MGNVRTSAIKNTFHGPKTENQWKRSVRWMIPIRYYGNWSNWIQFENHRIQFENNRIQIEIHWFQNRTHWMQFINKWNHIGIKCIQFEINWIQFGTKWFPARTGTNLEPRGFNFGPRCILKPTVFNIEPIGSDLESNWWLSEGVTQTHMHNSISGFLCTHFLPSCSHTWTRPFLATELVQRVKDVILGRRLLTSESTDLERRLEFAGDHGRTGSKRCQENVKCEANQNPES